MASPETGSVLAEIAMVRGQCGMLLIVAAVIASRLGEAWWLTIPVALAGALGVVNGYVDWRRAKRPSEAR